MSTSRMKAPPLAEGLDWLGVRAPIGLDRLLGRFVLLDFWTFG